jgi:redox-sensitive bicupin YhaK (pirin superfamily)
VKKLLRIRSSPPEHWVGDGFPVRNVFSYPGMAAEISPFLHLDYAGPAEFPPSESSRGVEAHPHRGFETVTIVYQGEVEHRDSAGNHGRIGPGDVQWMTAASGVVHEERHSPEFARQGGTLEMAQLWVNLPAKHKISAPRYQTILDRQIPRVILAGAAGTARVIAGELEGARGPAQSFTPVDLWDVRLKRGSTAGLRLPDGATALLLVLRGKVVVNESETAGETDLAVLGREGEEFSLEAREDASILVMGGEPIPEPVEGRGPFVMNTPEEIRRAMEDYRSGRMGRIDP